MKKRSLHGLVSVLTSVALVFSLVPVSVYANDENGSEELVLTDAGVGEAIALEDGLSEEDYSLQSESSEAPHGFELVLPLSATPNPEEIDLVPQAVEAKDEDEQAEGTASSDEVTTADQAEDAELPAEDGATEEPEVLAEVPDEEATPEAENSDVAETDDVTPDEGSLETTASASGDEGAVSDDQAVQEAEAPELQASATDETEGADAADELVAQEAEPTESAAEDGQAAVDEGTVAPTPEDNQAADSTESVDETVATEGADSPDETPEQGAAEDDAQEVPEVPAEEADETSQEVTEGEALTDGEAADQQEAAEEPPALTAQASGTCGSNLSWSLSGGTLTISGSGKMNNYDTLTTAPWSGSASSITKVNMKGGTSIGKQAFVNCSRLTSVSLPSTLTFIGEAAFYGCSSLTTVTLPSSVKTLDTAAFYYCSSLTKVTGGAVTALPDYVFGMTGMKTYQVPKTVKTVSSLAFYGTPLTELTVASGNTALSAKDGVLFADGGKTLVLYPKCKAATSYTVPSGVTKLEASSFQEVQNLSSLTIADSVKEAGYYTFYNSSLASITFGKGLRATTFEMLRNCTNLSTVNFGGLKSLAEKSFFGCTSLTKLTLPKTVTTIGADCFWDCTSLTTFSAPGLTEVQTSCFRNDSALKSLSIPSVTKIAYGAFGGCTGLGSFKLPNSCTFVHEFAFEKSVKLSSGVAGMKPYGANGYRLIDYVSIKRTMRYDYAFQVFKLVNKERAAAGLPALKMNQSLMDTAMVRAGELVAFFSHTRSDGSTCFSSNNLMYAENAAYWQTSPAGVMDSWMSSEGHRENIMNANYKTIGVGVVEFGGHLYWIQTFGMGSDSSSCSQPANKTGAQRIALAKGGFGDAETSAYGTVWLSGNTPYNYAPTLSLASSLAAGVTKQAKVSFTNPGIGMTVVPLQNKITWSSSDKAVVTVDASGKVTGVGSGTATIMAKLGATSLSKKVKVAPPSVANATVSSIPNQKYTGKAITPSPTVKFGGKTLKKGTDYTLSYKDNVKSGTASVIIKGKGAYSGTKTVTFKIIGLSGKWVQSGSGWWYSWNQGGYPTSMFLKIDGTTYYFDASGWMVTGWRQVGGSWYWFNSSGAMATGWRSIDGTWYWFASNGKMATGWKTISGKKYYFASSGAMMTGWVKSGGSWYWLESSGAMARNKWVDGGYYYVGSDGVMATNTWIGDYHVNASGRWDKTR